MRKVIAVIAVLISAAPALAAPADKGLTDEAVRKAIAKAVEHLYSAAGPDGVWDKSGPPNVPLDQQDHAQVNLGGRTALVLNALATAGQQNDPRFKKAAEWLMQQDFAGTYAVALRLNLIHNLPSSDAYRKVLKRDKDLLIRGGRPSSGVVLWSYMPEPGKLPYDEKGDFSNINYAVLGLWAASDERMEIETGVWLALEKCWVLGQHPEGGWSYYLSEAKSGTGHPVRGSLTAAGIASLYLVLDRAYVGQGPLGGYRKTAAYAAIQKGLAWMDKNFSGSRNPGGDAWFATYYFYNCERVAAAGGLKYFGTHDWFREIAETLLARQQDTGAIPVDTGEAYGGTLTDTAFALLFLTKGSAPIIVNKLQHAGDWDNRLRELGGLTDWLARESERPANWQVVDLKAPAEDLTDSRLLYISGTKPLEFTPQEKDKLRRHVHLGGMLVFHPDAPSRPFEESARKLARELWPELEFSTIDLRTHPLGTLYLPVNDPALRVEQLSTPTRMYAVMVHGAPAAAWERRMFHTAKGMFALGANLHYYVNDRAAMKDMPTKLLYFGETFRHAANSTVKDVTVARIKYGKIGYRWDPEPLAYERFAHLLADRERVGLNVKVVSPGELAGAGAKIALLTGLDDVDFGRGADFTQADVKALVEFVNSGGTLIVDQAGGPRKEGGKDFDAAFHGFVAANFGPEALQPTDLPALKNLNRSIFRNVGGSRRTKLNLKPECVLIKDRPAIIYSRYDLTCALAGCPNPQVIGADDETAYEIMSRLIGK